MRKVSNRFDKPFDDYFSEKLKEVTRLNKVGKPIINLASSHPDLPPHNDVIKTLTSESAKHDVHNIKETHGSLCFRQAVSDWYKRCYQIELNPENEILPLIGSKEGIMHICMTYLSDGDEALVPNPCYPTYNSAVSLAGGKVCSYNLHSGNNWYPDFKELEKRDLQNVKLMFMNYPHMPTGQLPTKKLFQDCVQFAEKKNILICHDNAYSHVLTTEPMSMLNIKGAKENVIELSTLSKSHNMSGWRIGMLCGAKERIAEVYEFKKNMDGGIFLPIQLAAAKALSLDGDWYDSINVTYGNRRKKIFQFLTLLSCEYEENKGGLFIWAKCPSLVSNGYDFSDQLLYNKDIFVIPGGVFGSQGENFIRVSLCVPDYKIDECIRRVAGH